jgi:hypothetical protein
MPDYLATLRRQLGKKPAFVFGVSGEFALTAAGFCERPGYPMATREGVRMLLESKPADATPAQELLGRELAVPDSFLADLNPRHVRNGVIAAVLRPLMILVLVCGLLRGY